MRDIEIQIIICRDCMPPVLERDAQQPRGQGFLILKDMDIHKYHYKITSFEHIAMQNRL